ncbi:LytR cell envelope-related transcriptional attenuator [Lentzea fradiae]|uniref:LytR cell envelope-related transcriptional attenuator n=1 Tax=Lentzea fradiae TaxID=200378 RepID=A0A1G7ZZX3_9PSEU|nr:envelope integrity protein Cei [Lentzea fradiae]SDH14107.1 LytR cell envelope-related transcriptional attenuator [Lentzea fradiae]
MGSASGSFTPYKRRRPVPALVLFTLLLVSSVFVWVKVLGAASDVDAAIRCNPPGGATTSATAEADPATAAPPPLGTVLEHDALDRTNPVPVSEVNFKVVNASTQRNHAKAVATMLSELGLKQAADPGNDAIYPAGDMACRGQIRFGAPGAQAARTLSLLEPCLELVRDARQDATVDVAIGKKFDEVKPNSDARKVLDQLAEWAAQQPEQQGGQVAAQAPPTLNPDNLTRARDVTC